MKRREDLPKLVYFGGGLVFLYLTLEWVWLQFFFNIPARAFRRTIKACAWCSLLLRWDIHASLKCSKPSVIVITAGRLLCGSNGVWPVVEGRKLGYFLRRNSRLAHALSPSCLEDHPRKGTKFGPRFPANRLAHAFVAVLFLSGSLLS